MSLQQAGHSVPYEDTGLVEILTNAGKPQGMAFSIAITGNVGLEPDSTCRIGAPRWNADELRADPHFEDVSNEPDYLDLEATRSVDWPKALADLYRDDALPRFRDCIDHMKLTFRVFRRHPARRSFSTLHHCK